MAKRATTPRREMADLQIKMRETDRELGRLNWELASELIKLAEQSDDPSSLIEAVNALRSATRYYTFEDAPLEHAQIQKGIADTLLIFGRKTGDREALGSARDAYRGSITLASLLSDDVLREELRVSYKEVLDLLGEGKKPTPLFRTA